MIRHDQRRLVSSLQGQIVYSQVSRSGGKLEVLDAVLEPGGVSSARPWTHTSEECVLIIEGSLIAEISDVKHVLATGDSCHFNSALPHRFLNPFAEQARFIISVTPPSN